MKKIFTYIIGIMLLSALFAGCEEKEDIFHRGVGIYLSNTSFYPLDAGLTGDVILSDETISEVEVVIDSETFTTISLSGGEGSYSFDKSELGIGVIGDELAAKFSAMVEGNPAAKNAVISVIDPLTKEGPADIPPIDTTVYIKYSLAEDCTAPTSLVITRAVNSDAAVELTGDYDMLKDSVAVDITPDMSSDTLTYQFTFENSNGSVVSTHQLLVIVKRFWDFESYDAWTTDIAPWTNQDLDGLGLYGVSAFDYPGSGEPAAWRVFNFSAAGSPEGWEPYSGDNFVFSMAAVPDGDQGNDDWLISDAFDIEDGYELSFYARSITDAYGLERLIVTVVNTADDEETVLTAEPYAEVPTDWTNYKWDLSNWAGESIKVKIGCVSYDAYALFVDDFEIMTGEGESKSTGFAKNKGFVPALTKK
jgi:hypothetical protein